MILVDTSAWIEFLRATGSAAHERVADAVGRDEDLATVGIVVLELLAGARDDRHARDLRRLLDRCHFLPLEEPSDYEAAAGLYRLCRRAGSAVRRLPDCLIAAVAIRSGTALLHQDGDFDTIARYAPLVIA